jgi:N-acetyl-gamma-glutamylphosphate reductase
MNSKISFTTTSSPVFDGINYQVWDVRMKAYLDANNIWNVVEQEYETQPLLDDPIISQIKNQRQEQVCLQLSHLLFFFLTKIMTLKTTKAIWDFF